MGNGKRETSCFPALMVLMAFLAAGIGGVLLVFFGGEGGHVKSSASFQPVDQERDRTPTRCGSPGKARLRARWLQFANRRGRWVGPDLPARPEFLHTTQQPCRQNEDLVSVKPNSGYVPDFRQCVGSCKCQTIVQTVLIGLAHTMT